eukprot:352500-Chlamydomonas_euryale.AAC.7
MHEKSRGVMRGMPPAVLTTAVAGLGCRDRNALHVAQRPFGCWHPVCSWASSHPGRLGSAPTQCLACTQTQGALVWAACLTTTMTTLTNAMTQL